MIRKDEPYRLLEFERKEQVYLDQVPIWIVSPEDLIISKLHWAKDSFSEMQLRDVKNLLCMQKKLDQEYLNHWIHKLNLKHLHEKAKNI